MSAGRIKAWQGRRRAADKFSDTPFDGPGTSADHPPASPGRATSCGRRAGGKPGPRPLLHPPEPPLPGHSDGFTLLRGGPTKKRSAGPVRSALCCSGRRYPETRRVAPRVEDHSDRHLLCTPRAKPEKPQKLAVLALTAARCRQANVKHSDTAPPALRQAHALPLGKRLPRGHPLPQ